MSTLETMFSTPSSAAGMSTDEIIKEFIRIDAEIKDLAYQRSEYSSALYAKAAEIRNGQSVVHLETADRKHRVKVEFKKEHVFDPSEIECAKELLGDERFNEIFKTEYTPRLKSLKTFLNTVSADERIETGRAIIKETLQEKEKTPYVSTEKK